MLGRKTHKNNIFRKLLLSSLLFLLLLLIFGTDPQKMALPLLVAPFILIFILIFLSLLFVIQGRLNAPKLLTQKSITIAITAAGIPVMLLVLKSIDQLSLRDILILLGLFGGILFYISRSDMLTS
ncbi:hypothetical protein HY003_00460 [Candidatus Saccharibacteria bacterium]|nr:hypothetical protein [Candidatus Saccharibacteria bacterium]